MLKHKQEQVENEQDLEIELPDKIDLLDLIDQPAWKTILIELVAKNRMDPWNIDLIELSEKYLHKISALETTNLRVPANAILALAIILKFKAKILEFTTIEDAFASDEKIIKDFFEANPDFAELKEMVPELNPPRILREGKITLDSLVGIIEHILSKSKDGKAFVNKISGQVDDFKIKLKDVNIDEEMNKLFFHIKCLSDSQGMVMFSQIAKGKSVQEIVTNFIYLLYLANNQRITIWQEEFWEEIFISIKKIEQEKI